MTGALYIDGAWRTGSGPALDSRDPATGEVVWSGPSAGPPDVAAAVKAARAAAEPWGDLPRDARIAAVVRYRSALQARASVFAEALSRETGKPLWETKAEVGSMVAKVDVSIVAYEERTGEKRSPTAFGWAALRHRPHGVMAVLGPFNFPGHLPNGHIVPALLAGDTVVFKPSEETPLAGEIMVECWADAGLPAGVVNLVQGGRETGAALIAEDIDGLLFTGSAAAGAQFRRAFVDRPQVILALELGGNNPLLVWDAADAEAVAALVVQSAYVTTGQRCSCARRLILPEGAAGDRVIEATAALAQRLLIGSWDQPVEPFMGPLISERAADQALAQAGALGGRSLLEMAPIRGLSGAFVGPGLIDVTGIDTPDEEIFAPVLQVRRVGSFDDALKAANATRYGLSAGLVSDDPFLWERFIRRSRAGVVNWNRPTTGASANMPFGGLGASGNHRPSAYYAADYCAYPVASFEADRIVPTAGDVRGLRPTPG